MQAIDVPREQHQSRTGSPLTALTQEDHAIGSTDRTEVRRIAVLPVDLEAERVAEVVLARVQVAHVEDGARTRQLRAVGARLRGGGHRVVAFALALAPQEPYRQETSQHHEPHGRTIPRPAGDRFRYARGVAYRDDAGDVGEAPTAEGTLRVEFVPRPIRLKVANRSIEISDAFITIIEHHRKHAARDKRTSIRIDGRVIVARDVPREGVGVWVEVEARGPRAGLRRIFGVEPINLLEPDGLGALGALDRLAQRLRAELAASAGDVRRAFEIGSSAAGGLDKVLVVDHGDRWVVHARRLFRDRARFAMAIHDDGRIVVRDGRGEATREITVRSRYGITVVGDFLRFADPQGADLARVAIPWIGPEDRLELAHRIGQLVDREHRDVTAWPPSLAPDADPAG